MRLVVILFVSILSIFSGKPAQNTEVYLEKGRQLIAYQITGEKGKIDFQHLDPGSYRISVILPQQDGKYIKEKPKHRTLTKATYNPKKKTYYYQGDEGFFALKFTGLSKIKGENFRAVFKEEHNEEKTFIVISEFGAHGKNASIGISVQVITAAQFKKASEKAGDNISMLSIPNIR